MSSDKRPMPDFLQVVNSVFKRHKCHRAETLRALRQMFVEGMRYAESQFKVLSFKLGDGKTAVYGVGYPDTNRHEVLKMADAVERGD